jgi:lipoic acid synthetase/lipoate-protein ligase A
MVVLMLQKLGIDASGSLRNDVMVGDKKVSGTAFYKPVSRTDQSPGRSIVHGTMLYDTDMLNMVGSITPSSAKLLSKGVASVRQRIALLKDYTTLTLDEFKAHVRKTLCDEEMTLTNDDIRCVQEIEQEYLSDDFIYGKNPQYTIVKKRRIEGVGEFEARIALKNGVIQRVNLMGDFFLVGDLDHGLLDILKGVPLTKSALRSRLSDRIDDSIMNLMTEDFVRLLTE